MKRYGRSGWFGQSYRHYLAAKGVSTNRYMAKSFPWKDFVKKGERKVCPECGGHVQDECGDWDCKNLGVEYDADGKERRVVGQCGCYNKEYHAKKSPNAIDYKKAPKGAEYEFYGVDSKGRRVRLYGKEHVEDAAKEKFKRIKSLEKKRAVVERTIQKDMNSPNEETRENARAAYVIIKTGLRPGSTVDTKGDVQAYGLTTLKPNQVAVQNTTTKFNFIGKKGVNIKKKISDPKLAKIVKEQKKLGEKEVFPNITDNSLRNYVRKFGNYKTKDLRTLYANEVAKNAVAKGATRKEVVQQVAKELNNTPSVAASSYIYPEVKK